jgi:putative AbiEii toxin of type IV toxin-antitoxin system/uncharacterized protein DUF3696
MLTSLSLANFKPWFQIDGMRLAPITGLFGTNSSGKTSILQLLLLMKQTVESPDRSQVLNLGDERSLTALGTFRDVIYGHNLFGTLRWGFSWTLHRELKVADPEREQAILFSGRQMGFEAEVDEGRSRRTVVKRMAYRFSDHEFGMEREAGPVDKYRLFARPDDFVFRRPVGRPPDLPLPVKCYGFPDQVRAYYQNAGFLSDFELAFEELFARTYYLGPLRDNPKREYRWSGAQPADMGRRGEWVVDALLAAQASGAQISRGRGRGHSRVTLGEYVALWLKQLGLVHRFSVTPIAEGGDLYRVWVQQREGSTLVPITDVGFGVSQILPVLVLCYYVPEGSTILLEQPEIHLHPSVQAGLADVFIDAVKVRKIQIVVESHSEHLLLRLQRRIAEQRQGFKSTDAALYFCELKGPSSRLMSLDLDEYGNIRNWPEGFFGDAFREAAEMSRAAIRRKRQDTA